MHLVGELSLFRTISGISSNLEVGRIEYMLIGWLYRLLDKIAKDIMVCENKTIRRWDGAIGEYKNYLRKKMVTQGQV